MVIGEPFAVGDVIYTPADTINYDRVGYASPEAGTDSTISGAHRTLPLPSYVEVTSLVTGRTILVRLERRGPLHNDPQGDVLIALSPGAAAQLGRFDTPRLPVRVRRVNPPESERAMLRTGQSAPARLETPAGLLGVLKRKLAAQDAPPAAVPPPVVPDPVEAKPAPVVVKAPAEPAEVKPVPPKRVTAPVQLAKGSFVIQLAAFSTRERARAAAARVGGQVAPAGKFWRLQMGPYPDRGKADAALAKARAAGYSDARIQRGN